MKAISLKMEEELLDEIDGSLKKNRYGTRTEFIRDAVREKLSELEKKELLKRLDKIAGSSDKKTTDEELHAIRDDVFKELEKNLNDI